MSSAALACPRRPRREEIPATKPSVRPDLDVVEVDGEAVVYDGDARTVHHLNQSAALVFSLCDGMSTVAQIAEAIADVYEMPQDEVLAQVKPLVADLRRLRLLAGGRARAKPPMEPEVDERGRVRVQVPRSS
jgi:hypothetical protein